MINLIWLGMILAGTIYALLNGRVDAVTEAVFSSAEMAVQIILGLVGIMGFWLGISRLAEESGLVAQLVKVFRPLGRFLFPSVPPRHPALGSIMLNLTSNLLGLGNAATPFGLRAMRQLQSLNRRPREASDAMCTFLALNTAGITLVPTMVIAVRAAQGATAPTEIMGTTLISTLIAASVAILADKLFRLAGRRRRPGA